MPYSPPYKVVYFCCPPSPLPTVQDALSWSLAQTAEWGTPAAPLLYHRGSSEDLWLAHPVGNGKCHCAYRGHRAAPCHTFGPGLLAAALSVTEFIRQVLAAGFICWQWEWLGKTSISCPPVQLFCDLLLMFPWLIVSLAEWITSSTISAVSGRAAAG